MLVMAAMAETKEKRLREYSRICTRFDVSTIALKRRLAHLGVRHVCASMGPRAIEQWKKQMRLLASALQNPAQLIYAIETKAEACNEELHRRKHRSVAIKTAAGMLRVSEAWLSTMAHDMGLLQLDQYGRVSLDELRRFYEAEGRSLLVRMRMAKKERAA